MAKKRMDINDVLGDDIQLPITMFEEADKREDGEPEPNKGGRPIKGRSKATKKVAYHVDEETWAILEKMMQFPKEKSVNAVCKRIVEAYTEPMQEVK